MAISGQRADAVLEEYERALAGAPLSAQTRRAYRSRVAGYLRWLADGGVADGDPLGDPRARDRAVAAYREWLRRVRGTRPTTLNAVLTALDHLYGHLRLGPVTAGREHVPAGVRRALPEPKRQQLLRAVERHDSVRDRAIVHTLLFTGVRVSELVRLDVPDVRLAARRGCLVVRGSSGRKVPLPGRPRPVLRAWVAERRGWAGAGATPALFLNRRGGRLSTRWVDDLVARLGGEAGFGQQERLTPQVLRYTFAAYLLHSGADLELVAELMGHTRFGTTRRYANPPESHQMGEFPQVAC